MTGSAGAAEPIKVGELNSYTRLPAFTFPYRDGWKMALDEINNAFDLMHSGKSIRSVVTF